MNVYVSKRKQIPSAWPRPPIRRGIKLASSFSSLSFLLLFSACIFSAGLYAQVPRYLVQTFGSRDGLLSPKIYSLYQSADRQLWVGSELGLSTFNGYNFRNYQYSADNQNIGRIQAITQDSLHGIWLGGHNGLFFYNDDKPISVEFENGVPLAIESLLTDRDGNLWVGDVTFVYKIQSEQIKTIHKNPRSRIKVNPFAGLKERAFGLAADRYNNVYMASHGGVYLFPPNADTYQLIWKNPDPNNYVASVTATSPDSIFWNRYDGHPTQLINNKQISYFDHSFLGRNVFTNKNSIYSITTRHVAQISQGVIPLVSFDKLANHAHTAIIDEESNIWVGTWEGLLKYRKSAFRVYQLPETEHTEIFSMMEQPDGTVLFGSNRGKIYTLKKDQIVPEQKIPALFKLSEVLCITLTKDGALWAGSGYQGISRYKNNQLKNWISSKYLKDNNCEALFDAGDGKLFACTENGVTVIDPLLDSPMTDHFSFAQTFSRAPELFGAFKSADNNFWFYSNQGLFKLLNKKLLADSIINMPVKSIYINKITAGKNGTIWVATQGMGLLKCSLENSQLVLQKQYTQADGLPSNMILSVLNDKNDNIWFADFMSLSMLDTKEGRIVSFNENDGLLSTYYQTLKLEQQKDGTIWGLSTRGVFSFHPDSVSQNKLAPSITFTNPQPGSPLTTVGKYSYRQPSIRFEYAAISLSDPSKTRYAYRLREADSSWKYTSSRVVDFSSLAPGRYTFELLASNNSNVWTPQPFQYRFVVQPPFWKTIWFRIAAASALFVLVFFLFKRRLAAVREKAAVKQQLAELEGKALRAQMNPHFIFNSLNAIQKLIVVQDMDSSYTYLSKFSKLLRLVLDNSDKNFILLSQELEMNRLYLELESLRFKNSFEYYFELNQQTDPDQLLIPSLLLQPFIENAVWHGLMHKDGEKKLWIRFREQDDCLICEIEDNGVGRAYSAAIKSQKLGAQHFNSKGTQLSEQRIRLLHEPGSEAAMMFTDLVNENGAATGTRVTIKIPLHKSNRYDTHPADRR